MAATPPSLFPEALTVNPIVQALPVSGTRRRDCGSKRKLITGLWDLKIPSELLQRILSGLGLKANIQASVVCKTWCEAAVFVRKLTPRPWLFYPLDPDKDNSPRSLQGFQHKDSPTETYALGDPRSWSLTRKLTKPALKGHRFCCSRDGWLLVIIEDPSKLIFFLNPFTGERIYLPNVPGDCLAFSAAPTSTSCLVISLVQVGCCSTPVIMTWRPGATVWTTHCFENHIPYDTGTWDKCVFSNGMIYCLSTRGYLGVFDPSKATWHILPVEPCPAFTQSPLGRRVLMMEHEGDVFLMSTRLNYNPLMFKLNHERKVWEEKRELGGLTVFASDPSPLTRAGLSAEDRNRVYTSHLGQLRCYFALGDGIFSLRPPSSNYLSDRIAWVDPPHNTPPLTSLLAEEWKRISTSPLWQLGLYYTFGDEKPRLCPPDK